ncbi:MAG: hypothetical protein ABI273_19100 [Lacunisphaera sp.]
MNANVSTLLRCAGLAAGAAFALPGLSAAAPTDAFPNFDSYIKITGQDAAITGDSSAFQKRTTQSQDGSVGIEDLHYSKDLNKSTSMVIDGRALSGSEDYLAHLNFTKEDFGSFDTGYKRFRTFYDGIGGFFPLSKTWMPLKNEDLHVDRGEFWAEVKLNRPDQPALTLRYSNATRTGQKDSTSWNDTDFTGLPNNNPPISQVRKLVPSYLDLSERHQTLRGSITHTVGKTTYELTLTGEATRNLDTRFGTRFPGEAKPFPNPAATKLLTAATMNNQIQYSQADGIDERLFNAIARTETVFNDKITLKVSAGFEHLTNDFSGDRPLYTVTPTAVGLIIAQSNNNLNLAGISKAKVYKGAIALDTKPTKDLSVNVALKGEDRYTRSDATLTSVAASVNTTTGVITTTPTNQAEYSRVKDHSLTPVLDINYTGFKSVSLFASASKDIVNGDEREITPYKIGTTPAASALFLNNASQDRAYYSIGAVAKPFRLLTVRGEVYYKDNTNSSASYGIDPNSYYELATQFTGVKLTVAAKLTPTLSSSTRYVYQKGKAQTTGYLTTTPEYDSMNAGNHMISETIDWTPNAQFYAQANCSLVFNTINTIYPRAGIAPASGTSIAWNVNSLIQNSDNNYTTASLLAGAVLTKADDLQIRVTYYRANNYTPSIALLSMPYGADNKEYSATVSLKHKFNKRLLGDFRVGYIDSTSALSGGNTDFRGPVACLSLTYAL